MSARLAAAIIAALLASCGSGGEGFVDPPVTPLAFPEAEPLAGLEPAAMSVETAGREPVTSRDEYVEAQIVIDGPEQHAGATRIRGRGNSTWDMPKKPYRLRLDAAAPLLGMPADRDWALLANYADKTLLRNALALDLAQRLSGWAPRWRMVELTLNGQYDGVYKLTEHVRVAPHRVNVEPLTPDDHGERATGGYLIELDARLDEDVCFRTERSVPFCVKAPGDIAPEQLDYLRKYVQHTEDALASGRYERFAELLDVPSTIDWFLVNEIFKSPDARVSSVYLHKPRGGKLAFGPAWDFDVTGGNNDYSLAEFPEGWLVRDDAWFAPAFSDPRFRGEVHARWCALRNRELRLLPGRAAASGAALSAAAARNFVRWDILGIYVWPNAVVTGSYQGEVDYLRGWLERRIQWLNAALVREGGQCR